MANNKTILLILGALSLAGLFFFKKKRARLYEYYNSNDDSSWALESYEGGNKRIAQTFTPSEDLTLTSVKVKLWRFNNPGPFSIAIFNTSDGVPNNQLVVSSNISASGITTDINGEWLEYPIPSVSLSSGVTYAIVIDPGIGGMEDNWIGWRIDRDDATYPWGMMFDSDDYTRWYSDTGDDMMFEVWGIPV